MVIRNKPGQIPPPTGQPPLAASRPLFCSLSKWTGLVNLLVTVIALLSLATSVLHLQSWTAIVPQQSPAAWYCNLSIGIVSALAGLGFLGWIHRAYTNLRALDAPRTRFSPAVAVLVCLIPVVNVLLSIVVIREIWKGSDPASFPAGSPPRRSTPDLIFIAWWIVSAISVGCGAVLIFTAPHVYLASSTPSAASLVAAYPLQIAVLLLNVVQCGFMFWMLRAIDQNQAARRERVLQQPSVPPDMRMSGDAE